MYDTKYADNFYELNLTEKSLERKTEQINSQILIYLINCYNLCLNIHNKDSEIGNKENFTALMNKFDDDSQDFYDYFLNFAKNFLNFYSLWQEETNVMENDFKWFVTQVCDFKFDYLYPNNFVAQMIFINYYVKDNREKPDFIKDLSQYNYTLKNLNYTDWSKKIQSIVQFSSNLVKAPNIIDYFCDTVSHDICSNIINISVDLRQRIEEQCIKYKFIKYNKLEYMYFDKLESKFGEKRSVYFLLYFVNAYNFNTEVKFTEAFLDLNRYVEIAKNYFTKDSTNLKIDFALATYYDLDKRELFDCDTINIKSNRRYILQKLSENKNQLDNNTLHYWKDDYYFITGGKMASQGSWLEPHIARVHM